MRLLSTLLAERDTVVVERTASVQDAARLMTTHQIGALPVVEGARVVGIFTERDVMSRVVAAGLDPSRTDVGSVMSTDLVVAQWNEPHEICLRRLQQNRVRHLIVLREGQLAGVLSMRDLVRAELDERDEAITLLNTYVRYVPADLARRKA